MNKISLYLQEHITGEIITNTSARNFYSTDASIFKIQPNVIIYPKNESDVRKTVKFSYQLAKNRRIFPITARGSGTDQSGAAIGPGLILVFPAHFNKLLELNGKVGQVRVEPGLNFGKLQQTLLTHDFFLPCAPASLEYSTIGGALANNAAGDRSVKYGPILDYVESLRVVLSNGDIIVTKRLSKRELNKKLGLSNYEGEIYRAVDKLIDDNTQTIHESEINTARNASGYNLHLVKRKDGSFDLTPLIVGSQGTLGVITEATLATIPRRPKTTLTVALIDDLDLLDKLLVELKKSSETPSAIEMVDDNLLNLVRKTHPNLIKDLFSEHSPKFVLLIEFDNKSDHLRNKLTKNLIKFLSENKIVYETSDNQDRIDELWKLRKSTSAMLGHQEGLARPVPFIEDGIVPIDKFTALIDSLHHLFKQNNVPIYIYGHAGEGQLHLQPLLDLGQVGDRQKIFKMMIEYYTLIRQFGGSISANHGDGRVRAPFIYSQYGADMYNLFKQIKNIFDPLGIMNTGVIFNDSIEELKPILRDEYNIDHLYDYLPYI